MSTPLILLALIILPAGDDDILLRVLRERGEVIATRIPAVTGAFLDECLTHLQREDLTARGRKELEAISVRAFRSWKEDPSTLLQHLSRLHPHISAGARDDLVRSIDRGSLSGGDLARLKEILGEEEEEPEPVTVTFIGAGQLPALDAYEKRWPQRVRKVDREGPRRFIPCSDAGGYEVEIPLEGGGTGSVLVTKGAGDEIILPDRFVEGMVLVIHEGIPFFIDQQECPGSRILRFLEDRTEGMDWLADQVSHVMDLADEDQPARLREDRTSLEVWRAITNYATFWEGKGIPREEEWQVVARPWLVQSGRRIQRWIGRGEMEPTLSATGAGPLGIYHLLGNAWEAVEGRRVVGGGAKDLPWELNRQYDQLLERSFAWGTSSVNGIGFRMVLRLQHREGN